MNSESEASVDAQVTLSPEDLDELLTSLLKKKAPDPDNRSAITQLYNQFSGSMPPSETALHGV
jgi:hypothetical protein